MPISGKKHSVKTFPALHSGHQLFPSFFKRLHCWTFIWVGFLLFSVLCSCDSGQTGEDSHSIQETHQETYPAPQNSSLANAEGQSDTRIAIDAPRIVAFGDSLTAGLGISQDLSYPAQLQQRIRQAGYAYLVINAGVNGDTTAGGLRRMEWVLRSRPSIVIVELGANDGLRGHPLEDTFSNLEQIIQGFLAEDVTVILAGMKIPPNYGQDYTSRFSDMYQTLAKRYQIPLIPFFLEGVAAIPGLNQADGIHPTGQGYTVVVENVMNVLEPILNELQRSN